MQQGERLPDSLKASTVAMVINVQISIRMLWNYCDEVDTKKKRLKTNKERESAHRMGGFTPQLAVMGKSLTLDPPYVLNTDVSPPVLLHHYTPKGCKYIMIAARPRVFASNSRSSFEATKLIFGSPCASTLDPTSVVSMNLAVLE